MLTSVRSALPNAPLRPPAAMAWTLLLVALSAASIHNAGRADERTASAIEVTIDPERDVFPILQARCVSCHNESQAEGGLRLDNYEAIQTGGHTSNPILGTVESSELLRRVTSQNDSYRMPKGEVPLTRDQIELLRRWISQGAPWPSGAMIALPQSPGRSQPTTSAAQSDRDDVIAWLDHITDVHEKLSWLLFPLVIFLGVMLAIERIKKQAVDQDADGLTAKQASDSHDALAGGLIRFASAVQSVHYLAALLLLALIASIHYHIQTRRESDAVLTKTLAQSDALSSRSVVAGGVSHSPVPEPYRPKHPKRLGGKYYRGNDERNEALFNNGYYRTAVMRVTLQDAEGHKLEWSSPIESEQLFVQLDIEKAPFATEELFSQHVIQNCFLSRRNPNIPPAQSDEPSIYLKEIEPKRAWGAAYPIEIERVGSEMQQEVSGLIYLYNNTVAHFGIRYRLVIRDDRLSDESELWMGAILLPATVQLPEPRTVLLNEWFDFLPIPEITHPNTEDPVLLGIPEHVSAPSE